MLANLLPDGFIEAQATWALWLVTLGSLAVLTVAADRAVGAAVRLAAALGMSKVIIGATVVSLGTTTPELFVSLTAALRGEPELALGNAVGSITADTAFIFGLCCLITRLPHDRFVLRRQGVFKLFTVAALTVPLVAMAFRRGSIEGVVLPRAAGFVYVGLLGVYLALSVRWARQHPEFVVPAVEVGNVRFHRARQALASLLILAVALGTVAVSSDVLIASVSQLACRHGVPSDVLAVTLVAMGTSMPELVTALMAIRRGHPELLVGNIIGADILNVLSVTGFSASASPLAVAPNFFVLHLPAMWASVLLFAAYIFTSRRTFSRWHGVPLLAVYAAYCALLIVTARWR